MHTHMHAGKHTHTHTHTHTSIASFAFCVSCVAEGGRASASFTATMSMSCSIAASPSSIPIAASHITNNNSPADMGAIMSRSRLSCCGGTNRELASLADNDDCFFFSRDTTSCGLKTEWEAISKSKQGTIHAWEN